jgi:hypothetical protein
MIQPGTPFGERGGRIRGYLDLAAGRYPSFVFGAGVGDLLPIFHFHDEPAAALEPKLRYLVENGYRTVTADDIARYVAGASLPERSVALCFDDAWASVWTTAGPLLATYGLRAIVYAIPGRMTDADGCRPRRNGATDGPPFMTWPELQSLARDATIDVQSHTLTHAMVFTSQTSVGFVEPGYEATPLLARPLLDDEREGVSFVSVHDLGAPLYRHRSRMSDGARVKHVGGAHKACVDLVASEGGARFFSNIGWRKRLEAIVHAQDRSVSESEDEQRRAIECELEEARCQLNHRLGSSTVNHVCLPWGVSGRHTAAALKRLGFATAVANRMAGVFAVRRGDDPYWLKRLPNRYIYRLPGQGRRWWFFERR